MAWGNQFARFEPFISMQDLHDEDGLSHNILMEADVPVSTVSKTMGERFRYAFLDEVRREIMAVVCSIIDRNHPCLYDFVKAECIVTEDKLRLLLADERRMLAEHIARMLCFTAGALTLIEEPSIKTTLAPEARRHYQRMNASYVPEDGCAVVTYIETALLQKHARKLVRAFGGA